MSETELSIQATLDYLSKLGFRFVDVEAKIGGAEPDIVVYGDEQKSRPIIIGEVKRQLPTEVELLHPAVQQAFRYAALIGNSQAHLLISDGKHHHWFKLKDKGTSLDYSGAPLTNRFAASDEKSIGENDRALRAVVRSTLVALADEGMRVDMRSARDILRIIVAQLFYRSDGEARRPRTSDDPRPWIQNVLSQLFASTPIDGGEWVIPEHVVREALYVLGRISRANLLRSTTGRLFWTEIAPLLIEPDQTRCSPPILAEFLVDLVAPKRGERVIDPACGSGQFLTESYLRWALPDSLRHIGEPDLVNLPPDLVGYERDPIVAEVAQLNCILAGLGANSIRHRDGLRVAERFERENSGFDVVISDPPVGKTTGSTQESALSPRAHARKTETAFVERAINLLRVGGRAVLLLPEGFFFSQDRTSFRAWLLRSVKLSAVVSLPPGAWTNARSHTQASVLVFTKGGTDSEYPVFVADLRTIGKEQSDVVTLHTALAATQRAFARFLREPDSPISEEHSEPRLNLISSRLFSAERMDVAGVLLESWRQSPASLPNRYSVVKLADIAEIILGRHIRRNPVSNESAFSANYIQAGNVRRFYIELADVPRLSLEEIGKAEAARLRPDDVLITSTGQYLGRAAIVDDSALPAIASNAVTVLRTRDRERVDPKFLVAFLNSPAGIEQFEQRRIKGVAQPYLRRADIEAISIPLPPLKVQQTAVAEIWNLLARADSMVAEAETMKARAHTLLLDVLSQEQSR
jgi:hypothetical protein